MKLKYTPIILFLLINILFDKSYASSFFLEDFNNSYSYSNVWTEYKYSNDDINFNEYPGSISLRSNSYNFPMITSSNIFPESNNFDLSFLFQYRQIGNQFGTGIVISDNKPVTYPYINTSSNSMFQVWQDGSNNLNYAATIIPKTGIPYTYISGFYIFHKTSLGKDSPHTINLKLINNKYYFYVDNVLLYESQETNRRPNSIWFGNPVQVNQLLGWHNLSIDYIKINKLPDKELDVPYFSQNDSQWGSDTYDHMTETIDQKGCAMTSAAMLLNYYGIDVTPNNDPMNPKTLNEWLNDLLPAAKRSGYLKQSELVFMN